MRVVSLVPSVTETLTAWGQPPIACTRFCERPDLPHVGGTKNPDVAAIVALAPDLVVLDRQENRREDADALEAAGLELVVLDVRSVAGLADDLARLASAVGATVPAPGGPARLEPLETRAFVPIWHRPWMTIGPDTYGSSVLAALGVANVFGDAAEDYPEVTLADVSARQPDVVLVPSEPYVFRDPHVAELGELAPVVRVDGQDLFWWGARTASALHRLHASIRAGLTSG
jgi:ABC-type Fe3+-hydroxamate transport system substrate-binding protein